MQTLTIRQVVRERESFGDYHYEIFRGGKLVARFAHDYRGDECWFTFLDGRREDPGSGVVSFLEGGGPQPLRLSDAAQRFLEERLPPGD